MIRTMRIFDKLYTIYFITSLLKVSFYYKKISANISFRSYCLALSQTVADRNLSSRTVSKSSLSNVAPLPTDFVF